MFKLRASLDERLAEEASLVAAGLLPDAELAGQPAGLADFLATAEVEMAAAMVEMAPSAAVAALAANAATASAVSAVSAVNVVAPSVSSSGTAGEDLRGGGGDGAGAGLEATDRDRQARGGWKANRTAAHMRRRDAEQRGDRSSVAAAEFQLRHAPECQRPSKRAAVEQRSGDKDGGGRNDDGDDSGAEPALALPVRAGSSGDPFGKPQEGGLSPCPSQQQWPADVSPDCVLVGVSTAADRAAAARADAVVISSPVDGGGGGGGDALDRTIGQYLWGHGDIGSVRQALAESFDREEAGSPARPCGAPLVWRRSAESSPGRSLIFHFGHGKKT